MPTYEFLCPAGHKFDRFMKMSESVPELPCPDCGETAARQMSGGAGLVFKGSGFYLTDYGRNAHRTSGTAKPPGDTGGGESKAAGGESKPAGGESKSGSGDSKPSGGESKSSGDSASASKGGESKGGKGGSPGSSGGGSGGSSGGSSGGGSGGDR